MTISINYQEFYSYSKSTLFDLERMNKLFKMRWFSNCVRCEVSSKNDLLIGHLFDESCFIIQKL